MSNVFRKKFSRKFSEENVIEALLFVSLYILHGVQELGNIAHWSLTSFHNFVR